ncbi:uncharacterized protein [Epargyreus clarus]|uniref:uncharacterized protein n=1 Tax=Epargyreus clarus TaxID=520877 RepID=UPI003C2B3158
MLCVRQVLICVLLALVTATLARPDSAGHYPDPPPGISHGGIPYGSMSGNVAAYYKNRAPSGRGVANFQDAEAHLNFAPIEQWL